LIYYTESEPRKIEDEFFDVAYDIDTTSPNDILEVNIHGFGGPIDSMLINGVISLKKHKRNGTR
jgi:hypothetical protein